MRARRSRPSGLANGASVSSTSYGAATSKRTVVGISRLSFALASAAQGGQDLDGEALQLRELVVADEPDAEVGDAGGGVAAEGLDDGSRGPEPHRAPLVDPAAVVRGEEVGGHALGRGDVILQAHRRVHAEREIEGG